MRYAEFKFFPNFVAIGKNLISEAFLVNLGQCTIFYPNPRRIIMLQKMLAAKSGKLLNLKLTL